MPKVQFVGRKSLHFFGKYMSEIARNLKNRGEGRVVVKETEAEKYKEPCFYVLKRVVPLLSDDSNVRCRAWGQRIFRGRDLGVVLIDGTHEPDWRLLSSEQAELLISSSSKQENVAPDIPVKCTAPMPPLLALHLRQNGRIPAQTIQNAEAYMKSKKVPDSMVEAEGFLLLTKQTEDPTSFQVPIEPSPEERQRIHPPYSVVSKDGLLIKPNYDRKTYYIRRADTPGLYWKVFLSKDNDTDADITDKKKEELEPSS
ncbi:unnamed protein product [Calicophoron daubneyi]|uniref:Mitochondrial ribosomal protein S34 n=1 Tax=Calicophoron daubneyi TaxID=300641 RepID=A0AAV2TDZ7_CALDB